MTEVNAMPKSIVLYDGECPLCCKTTAILRRFDWLHLLRFHNCRDAAGIPANNAHLDPARMIAEMHVLAGDRETVYSGFRAVRWIAGRVPLLWLLYPLMFVPGVPRIGQRVYLWIARNRFQLVPCRDGVCSIPPQMHRAPGEPTWQGSSLKP
jgi:predicted DCC family thiol-disulfide oxidoreductase YuxK